MEMDMVGRWTRLLSQVALALAGLQLLVAVGVAIMPPPASSEGGPEAGLLYALYYAAPLAVLGLALRSRSGWLMAGIAVLAFALVALHSAPLIDLRLRASELPWQRISALVVSGLSGLLEATIFVVAVISLLARRRRRRPGQDQGSSALRAF
ncbi:MAG TPA: hypothetical protein VF990_07025 [Candidatus Dormibacteraeota bacterium]